MDADDVLLLQRNKYKTGRRWGVTEIQDIREHQCHLQFVSGKVRLFNMYFAA